MIELIIIVWIVCGLTIFSIGLDEGGPINIFDFLIGLPFCMLFGPVLILKRVIK